MFRLYRPSAWWPTSSGLFSYSYWSVSFPENYVVVAILSQGHGEELDGFRSYSGIYSEGFQLSYFYNGGYSIYFSYMNADVQILPSNNFIC
ncbi:hypothetical protein EB796_016555 [Bugula neritina]|uniref:Uncharacterized protein n=1 Tax=Bugula neritina TaxID=10212 RepID=A0A7J7JFR1_BUGNE|nr:hypothetical protein EB796_016555 [Bugula neritina]